MRNEVAAETVKFATATRDAAAAKLKKSELALTEFLAKHSEFVADPNSMQSGGASIRAARNKPTGAPQLTGKERQLQRIEARLNASPNSPPMSMPSTPSQERIDALAKVAAAKRELEAAKRELEDQLAKYTEQYPSAIKAKDRVANATQQVRQAEDAVPAETETIVRPATGEDRTKLEKERQQLQAEIRDEASRTGRAPETQSGTEQRVVQLETENNDLQRVVRTDRERLQTANSGWERANQDANQKAAEQGGRLLIVDPAFKPARPNGPGKSIFLMAGVVLFLSLGLSFAIALAVIDDRLYRRADLDHLGIPVLAVIPPAIRLKGKPSAKAKTKAKQKGKGGAA
jgi:hypothetical protein